MSTVRRIAKNSGASLIAQVSTPISSFVLVFFIARYLGATGLGQYSSALALLFIFQAFTSMGFPYLVTREVSRYRAKAKKFLINGSFISFFVSLIMGGGMCISIDLITDSPELFKSVCVLSVSLIPYSLAVICQSISRGYEKLEHIAIAMFVGNLFKLVFGYYVLSAGYDLLILIVVIVISHFIIFFVNLYPILKIVKQQKEVKSEFDFEFQKWIIRSAPVFALILIVSTVRMNIDMLILNNLLGDKEVGFYSAAYKMVKICTLAIGFYVMAVQPVLFRLYKTSTEKFKKICLESTRYFCIMLFPIIVGTILLGDRFIILIYGEEFLPSNHALQILIVILIMTGFNQVFANALIASNNQRRNLEANILGMVSTIALNLVLIPQIDFIGAAMASVISTFITLVFQYYFIQKVLFKINFYFIGIKALVSSLVMGGFIALFIKINLFLLIILSIIVYFTALLLTKGFSKSDIEILKKLIKGEKEVKV